MQTRSVSKRTLFSSTFYSHALRFKHILCNHILCNHMLFKHIDIPYKHIDILFKHFHVKHILFKPDVAAPALNHTSRPRRCACKHKPSILNPQS